MTGGLINASVRRADLRETSSLCCHDRLVEKNGNRDWPDSARDRADQAGREHCLGHVHVSLAPAVVAGINDHRFGFQPFAPHQLRATNGGDK